MYDAGHQRGLGDHRWGDLDLIGTNDFLGASERAEGPLDQDRLMIAFDLLYLVGYNLRKLRLIGKHKALLKQLVDKNEIQFSESFEIWPRDVRACLQGWG